MKISVCIACHNQGHLLADAVDSCLKQEYEDKEIVVLDDASTDMTKDVMYRKYFDNPIVKHYRSNEPSGTGGAFNKAISYATGDVIVLLCSDDVFNDTKVLSDIAEKFKSNPHLVHLSRYYHQFIDGDRSPVRAWRMDDVYELANNPSGLAFRAKPIRDFGIELSNKMFVEAATMVHDLCMVGDSDILRYDTVAVRIHQSISRSKDYYLKRWTSSPVEEWAKVGGSALANDFTSLIQIKNYFTIDAVIKECVNFVKVKPKNIINPAFWFFSLVAILTPRWLLLKIPHWYRITWGRAMTKEVKRP